MKSYTDIEQSKKLAEILPLESADGFWEFHTEWGEFEDKWEGYEDYPNATPYFEYTRKENEWKEEKQDMPCWSLVALLNLMICPNLEEYIKGKWDLTTFTDESLKTPIEVQDCKSAIDACYEMILKLYKLKLIQL